MARPSRLLLDNYPVHVVQRGHNRERCFFDLRDYRRYLDWLDEAMAERDCLLHAYVLMTNHVHLLFTPNCAARLPGLMQSLGRRYVGYVNKRYGRSGTLWEGRYRSSVVQSDTYLLACHRYIELNPVRAAIVSDPADYDWSSYRANALGRAEARLSLHPVFLALGGDGRARCEAYRRLFEIGQPVSQLDDIRLSLNQSQPLGNRSFQVAMQQLSGASRVARPRGRPAASLTPFSTGNKKNRV